jgi:hypothetical protein
MSKNIICPKCKNKVPLPEDKELWMKMGEERLLRRFTKFYYDGIIDNDKKV